MVFGMKVKNLLILMNGVYDEGEDFIDELDGKYDEGVDQYYYIQYIKSNQLIEYTGELFTDCNSKECIENQVWNIDEGIVWDIAETFDDLNYNGVWDAPNGFWDEGEIFIDEGNGVYDLGEKFEDHPNGKYDEGEEFIDCNG